MKSSVSARCSTFPFEEPTPENCNCWVVIGDSDGVILDTGNQCRSCVFVPQDDTTDGHWEIAYDCSNLVEGPCAERTLEGTCIGSNPNNLTEEILLLESVSECLFALSIESLPFAESQDVRLLPEHASNADAGVCAAMPGSRTSWTRWYAFQGTGKCVNVAAVGDKQKPILRVFKGECGSLACVFEDINDFSGPDVPSETQILAEANATYYVLLSHPRLELPFGSKYAISISVS